MYGAMDRAMGGAMNGAMDVAMDGAIEWTHGSSDGRSDGLIHGWSHGRVDRWMERSTTWVATASAVATVDIVRYKDGITVTIMASGSGPMVIGVASRATWRAWSDALYLYHR